MTYKNKLFMTKKKAFTLIELLIVIAIIGILFIVLVSKVDFATDKAKATGVQTDFRSFQVAIESVAKEHAGLATFGWDTGDANGDRIRNSYDKGDTNKNGIQDEGEIFIGSKTYGETWTNIYTLTNPADADDRSAIVALEEAINKNLDPKLHITINDDLTITMANGAQDPWNTEYHGYYITNATTDGKDRGAIVIYSNGANQEWGSEHSIANGVVTVNVPGNNVYGKDDYSIVSVYTYVNGYGEVKTATTGFSNNQGGGQAGTDGTFAPGGGSGSGETPDDGSIKIIQGDGLVYTGSEEMKFISDAEFSDFEMVKINGVELDTSNYTKSEGSTIIVLDQRYCYGLANGQYTISIVSSTGTATCNFIVAKISPQLVLNKWGFYDNVLYQGGNEYVMFESEANGDVVTTFLREENNIIIPYRWSYDEMYDGQLTGYDMDYTFSDDGLSVTVKYGYNAEYVCELQEDLIININDSINTIYTDIDGDENQTITIDKDYDSYYGYKVTLTNHQKYTFDTYGYKWEDGEEGSQTLVIYNKLNDQEVAFYYSWELTQDGNTYHADCGCSLTINENSIDINAQHEATADSCGSLMYMMYDDIECLFIGYTYHVAVECSPNSNYARLEGWGE